MVQKIPRVVHVGDKIKLSNRFITKAGWGNPYTVYLINDVVTVYKVEPDYIYFVGLFSLFGKPPQKLKSQIYINSDFILLSKEIPKAEDYL